MSKTKFFLAFEADLQFRHVPFDLAELQVFVEDVGKSWAFGLAARSIAALERATSGAVKAAEPRS